MDKIIVLWPRWQNSLDVTGAIDRISCAQKLRCTVTAEWHVGRRHLILQQIPSTKVRKTWKNCIVAESCWVEPHGWLIRWRRLLEIVFMVFFFSSEDNWNTVFCYNWSSGKCNQIFCYIINLTTTEKDKINSFWQFHLTWPFWLMVQL